MKAPTPYEVFADTVSELIEGIVERPDLDQETTANHKIVVAAHDLVYELTKQIDGTLPTITAIEQTSQGEAGRRVIELTKAVRRAIKAVRNA